MIPEIVELPADAAGQAAFLSAAVAAADGPVVWLAPPGEGADAALLAGLSAAGVQVRVLNGAHDLPGAHLLDLVSIMDTLRVSCPWDREQTHASLVRYLLEEAYEAVETVEDGDLASLREELGDVLLQVLFHARIAAERAAGDGGFTIDDVADTLAAKLIRRHPHVFGSTAVSSAADVNRELGRDQEGRARAAVRRGRRRARRPCSTGCRSGSPRCRWPRSCSGVPSGPGCPVTLSQPVTLAGTVTLPETVTPGRSARS